MYTFFLIMFLLVALILIFLIMLQQNKGIDIFGDSFNISNSLGILKVNTSGNFITRLTAIFGFLFFFLSLILGNISHRHSQRVIVRDQLQKSQSVMQYSNSSLGLFDNTNNDVDVDNQ